MLYDPFVVPVLQRSTMHVVGQALESLDDTNLDQIAALVRICQENHLKNPELAVDQCNNIMNYITAVTGDVNQYDARQFKIEYSMISNPVIEYLSNSSKKEILY